MAAHSSIVAWKIPWTEEPGRLQSMESQRVRHNCAASLSLPFTFSPIEVVMCSKCSGNDHHSVEDRQVRLRSEEPFVQAVPSTHSPPRRICLILGSSCPRIRPSASGPTEPGSSGPQETVPSKGKDSTPGRDRPFPGCVTSGWGHSLSELQR